MHTLDTTELVSRDTNCGLDIAGMGVAPCWREDAVVIAYKNAFGEEIVDVFSVEAKILPEGVLINASAITTLQFWAPASWSIRSNAAITEYTGQYDTLPKAGLGAPPAIVDNVAIRVTHLDILGENYDEL